MLVSELLGTENTSIILDDVAAFGYQASEPSLQLFQLPSLLIKWSEADWAESVSSLLSGYTKLFVNLSKLI